MNNKLIEQIEKFTTSQIIEALEQQLQNEGETRENLIISIKEWSSDAKEDLLNYLNDNFKEE